MKTLYLDIFSGISGDMFIGALIDLGVDAHALEHELEKLKLDGYHLHVARKQKAGIEGVKFDVHLAHEHDHEHAHGEHDHTHDEDHSHEHEHGTHGGLLLKTRAGLVEVSVFETNVPPRFRLYFLDKQGQAAKPMAEKDVTLETIRDGERRQVFKFKRHGDFLEATDELPEPHEFKAVLKLKRGTQSERIETHFVEDHHHEHGHHDHDHEHQHGHTHEHTHHDEHGHAHTHSHEHHHHDDSRNFAQIKTLIGKSTLSVWVKEKSLGVFQRIAEAEGKIHGMPPEQVHFHEVGAVDSIVDIVGACLALEMLGKPRVLAAAVQEGVGWMRCAHGRFPIPAPATLAILGARGVGVTQTDEPHELVTPTGAALLAEFAESFGPMSNLVPAKIGFGLGTRDNHTRPNVLRAVLGTESKVQSPKSKVGGAAHDWETDRVAVIETNLDDINAEILGNFVEQALAEGTLDVFHTPIQMKKNRPGVLLTVLCAESDADKFSEMMLRETSAFGVRRTIAERRKLKREFVKVKTSYGEVTVKLGKLDGKVVQASPEFESCKKLAQQKNVPVKQVHAAAVKALRS